MTTYRTVRGIKPRKKHAMTWGKATLTLDNMIYGTTGDSLTIPYSVDSDHTHTVTTSDTVGIYGTGATSSDAYYWGQDQPKLPTYKEFDSDYSRDTQDKDDPLKIMKRIARGCYKGNSCIKCNDKRIEKEYYEKYDSHPTNAFADFTGTAITYSPAYVTWQTTTGSGWRTITSDNASGK